MLYYMIWAFAIYSLLLLPVFYYYGEGQAYARTDDDAKIGYA